ncbi:MAG: ATP-binding protein [Cyanobacteria bacterium P01_D01_bin.14]
MLFQSSTGPILYIETLSDQPRHFDKLVGLWQSLHQLPLANTNLTLNFNYCEFLGHNGVAFLGGLAQLVKQQGGAVRFEWDSLRGKIYASLKQNGFLYAFGENQRPQDGNAIPYRQDCQFDHRAIIDYLQYYWLGKGWINITDRLQQAITGQASELYLNAFDHSQSAIGVFSCGQHYPKAGVLQLSVVDFGIGIASSVRALPQNQSLSTVDALEWALQAGNTTQQQGISRGLGLHLLQSFIHCNGGSLLIYSNDGCIQVSEKGVQYAPRAVNFAGTLVNITLQCNESVYDLETDSGPDNVAEEDWF